MQTRSQSFRSLVLTMTMAAGLAACSSHYGESEKVTAARTAVERAESLVQTAGLARSDLEQAKSSLAQAEAARKNRRPQEEIDNFAYSAEQSAQAAINHQEAASAEHQRDAAMALHKAETAETEARRVQQLATQSAATN